jgi:hypothetical protein
VFRKHLASIKRKGDSLQELMQLKLAYWEDGYRQEEVRIPVFELVHKKLAQRFFVIGYRLENDGLTD